MVYFFKGSNTMKNQDLITFLVIEDDDVDFIQIRKSFQELNICNPIIRARHGEEGKEIIQNEQIQGFYIILLDLNMPKMNGHEFMSWLRSSKYSKASVIVMTTSKDASDIDAAFSKWVAGYLVKPLDTNDFVEVMSTLDKYWSFSEMPTSIS